MPEEAEFQEINIPVVAFPPFKLRSSLIDKDPVIWQFLIEDYITLFKKLILITESKGKLKLSVKSTQQLAIFMKVYLNEVSQETTRIFSLGAINPDIIKNQKLLKLIVFKFIKTYNLINLKIGGDSIWNFLKIYIRLAYENSNVNQSLININIVRSLIDGTVKSKLNSRSDDISLIKTLHDYLKQLISEAKFNRSDLETLTMLIGQKYQKSMKSNSSANKQRLIKNKLKGGNNNNNNNNNNSNSEFNERFVNSYWIQILESLYNGGESIHSKTVFEIMVVSLISLPTIKIANLLSKDLNITNKVQLVKSYPLLSKIIFSKKFNDLNPDFKEKAKFLNKTSKVKFNNASSGVKFDQLKIKNILELFPQLSEAQVKTLMLENNHEVDLLVARLLENPDLVNNIKEFKETTKPETSEVQKKTKKQQQNTYTIDDKQFSVQFGKKQRDTKMDIQPDEQNLKQTILNSALRMLYESDEDEPDDTYDSQEITTATGKLRISDDINDDEFEENKRINKKMEEETNKIEEKLFIIYKHDPESLSRTGRYTNYRQQLKAELNWTDEQIEGWARMLQKSPKRFKMLEHQYINVDMSLNSNLKPRSKYNKKKVEEIGEKENDGKSGKKYNSQDSKNDESLELKSHKNFNQYMDKKKAAHNKTKNKSSIANHNRKAGHDRKMAKMGL